MSNKTIVKLGLFCAVLVVLKWIWESDAALNAIILFGTAGVIPGTGIVLTPGQVYMVLSAVLLASVLAIFSKNIRHGIRRARANRGAPRKELLAEAGEAGKAGETAAVSRQPKPVVVITIPAEPTPLAKAWRAVRPKILVFLGVFLELAVEWSRKLAVVLRRLSLKIYRHGVRAWLWAEPRIRRFDKQIETTLKRNKDIAAVLHACSVAMKTVHGYAAAARAWLSTRFGRVSEE